MQDCVGFPLFMPKQMTFFLKLLSKENFPFPIHFGRTFLNLVRVFLFFNNVLAKHFVRQLLQKNIDARPDAEQALSHPWLAMYQKHLPRK